MQRRAMILACASGMLLGACRLAPQAGAQPDRAALAAQQPSRLHVPMVRGAAGDGCAACAQPHATIIAGLDEVQFPLVMSRVAADSSLYAPLIWASAQATGGDRAGLAGTLPSPGWIGQIDRGRVVVWAGHEGAWTQGSDARRDNDVFRQRVIAWLLAGGTRLGFTAGHGEWLTLADLSPRLRTWLEATGVQLRALMAPLDEALLATVDALVFGNPWGGVADGELDALDRYVRAGGGVLATGLGWSWRASHDDPQASQYPLQRLGMRLGFAVMDGGIEDPADAAGTPAMPAYALQPLAAYAPMRVVVLTGADAARVAGLAAAALANAERVLFVIEGDRMGLALPTEDWALLADPVGAIAALDRIYRAELELAGSVRPPFGGEMVWLVPRDAPDAAWWMHSGNPIVFQRAAARQELIPRFNGEGHPGWGIAHEQGHNMHAAANDLYVPEVTVEVWPNVFGLWSYRQNGWSWAAQMGAGLFAAGHAYHARATPAFADLAADPFILLGCFDLLIGTHGWDGMRAMLTQAARDAADGMAAGDDAARLAYLVERLSAGYQRDLTPLFRHWGFVVSDASAAVTAQWPATPLAP
jgi:hypothetical protein